MNCFSWCTSVCKFASVYKNWYLSWFTLLNYLRRNNLIKTWGYEQSQNSPLSRITDWNRTILWNRANKLLTNCIISQNWNIVIFKNMILLGDLWPMLMGEPFNISRTLAFFDEEEKPTWNECVFVECISGFDELVDQKLVLRHT